MQGPLKKKSLIAPSTYLDPLSAHAVVDNGSSSDLQNFITETHMKLREILTSFDDEADRIICTEVDSWLGTTMSFCDDTRLVDELKELTENCRALIGSTRPGEASHHASIQSHESSNLLVQQKRSLIEKLQVQLSRDAVELDHYRKQAADERVRYSDVKQATNELQTKIDSVDNETECSRFERMIDLEIPLQMKILRREKGEMIFQFFNLHPEMNQSFNLTVNTLSGRCHSDPYSTSVEKLWSRFAHSKETWNWQEAFVQTRLCFKKDLLQMLPHEVFLGDSRKRPQRGMEASNPGIIKRQRPYDRKPNESTTNDQGLFSNFIKATSEFIGLRKRAGQ